MAASAPTVFPPLIAANASLRASVRHDLSADGHTAVKGLASGFKAIDRYLPWQGWPIGAMTEIMTDVSGRGELSLLLPAMARIAEAKRQIVCIGAPHVLFSPALEQVGIDPGRVNHIHAPVNANAARSKASVDALWATEQVLKSGTAGLVLLWTRDCSPEALHRLQLAVSSSETVMMHFRATTSVMQRSPAWLRMTYSSEARRIRLQILKCRGHLMTRPLIEIDRATVQPRLFAQLDADRFLDIVTRFGTSHSGVATDAASTSSHQCLRSASSSQPRQQSFAVASHVEPDAT